ncbi:MAG: phosphonopyruvate decarboxylase [Spirochaetales bacterium]|nr:phosphonopyruvate decarboxylase [Spirochaetales bacterium]
MGAIVLEATAFVQSLQGAGFDFYTGVPCSYLKPLINSVIDASESGLQYIPATIEGEAAALAAGAWLAGRKGVVLLQNSGLGNLVNPLTSLHLIYGIPALFLVTWRATPGQKDAYQHEIMGRITPDLLRLIGVPFTILEDRLDGENGLHAALAAATDSIDKRQSYAFIIKKDLFSGQPLKFKPDYRRERTFARHQAGPDELPDRDLAMKSIHEATENTAIVATTGFTSRSLFNTGDRPGHFYMQGSMGFALSIGTGISLFNKGPVVVIDGDGSLLMRASTIFTSGLFHKGNLLYILLDNNVHDSTGGQRTISSNVDFSALAQAAGFDHFYAAGSAADLGQGVKTRLGQPGPLTFFYLRIAPGAGKDMDRPDLHPTTIAGRMRAFLQNGNG